ncbi:hypothetical protein CBM2598_P300001 [Cupriavidus taiwanensis]|uniref:Integrase catalytic domain-containing protein n=1 Tax=Cupriavidus taiwanensis TaxID=164546 RepID=A0A7Z7NR60_9BURK|nr:hypothetical protein CBM2597_P320002 [Cupriavidus taiwanensis]SOZ95857.1 hypothetical protein CBM2598_P300001 [Cupriavidus taiwanensis]SPC25368.1 hypothetical protein CBM2594_P300001 [Cupriavidus taiwanensis]
MLPHLLKFEPEPGSGSRFAGAITPVIPWRHYAEDLVAPIRRRRIGSIMPAIHIQHVVDGFGRPLRRRSPFIDRYASGFWPEGSMNRRFEMFHYRQVLVRMRQGDSDRDIARSKTMGRRKLSQVRETASNRGWLGPDTPLPTDAELAEVFGRDSMAAPLPPSCVSPLEAWREQIVQWHAAGIQGTTILSALERNHGYCGSTSSIYRFLKQIKESEVPEVPMRLEFKPAEAAQIDFGAGPTLTDVYTGEIHKTWYFVMTLCWSRHQYVEIVRDQTIATWLQCHRHAFEWFHGVPVRLIIDNPKCAITRACIYEPEVQRAYAQCAEGYGFRIDPCPPRDPQKKGIVESGVKYVKNSFGPLRDFRDLADANRQVRAWVMAEAGTRIHGTTRQQLLTAV